MNTIFEPMGRLHESDRRSIADWDAAVRHYVGRLVRRKSILRRHNEELRTVVVELEKLQPNPEYLSLLGALLKAFRRVIRQDTRAALTFLQENFLDTVAADGRWLSIFLTWTAPDSSESPHERVARILSLIGSVLEGCAKPHVAVLFGLLSKEAGKSFPAVRAVDFGVLVGQMPRHVRNIELLFKDPVLGIPMHHWRNISAHGDYVVTSQDRLRVAYGRGATRVEREFQLPLLEQVCAWAIRATSVLRLGSVLIYLEYMTDLSRLGLKEPPLRFESFLVGLCHNLGMVGFRCRSINEKDGTLILRLTSAPAVPVRDAIIHASQVLDRMGVAVDADAERRSRMQRVAVELVSDQNTTLGEASVDIKTALAFTLRKLSMKRYKNAIEFRILDSPKSA